MSLSKKTVIFAEPLVRGLPTILNCKGKSPEAGMSLAHSEQNQKQASILLS